MADTNAILFVQHAAPKITELTCPIEALMLSNFPVMNLNKFIVRSNIFHEQRKKRIVKLNNSCV